MDPVNSPEVPIKSPPNKKLFIGAIAVVGIVIIFIFVSILSSSLGKKESSTPTQQQPPSNYQSVNSNNPNSNSIPSNAPVVIGDWKVYKNSFFSLNYPPDWKIEELQFPNGEIGTSIRPVVQTSANPTFLVTSSPSSTSSATTVSKQAYLSLGFSRSSVIVDNIEATKLSGTIPPKSSNPAPGVNVIQASHIYLSERGSDYLLKFTYADRSIDQTLEAIFQKMISSFKLAQ